MRIRFCLLAFSILAVAHTALLAQTAETYPLRKVVLTSSAEKAETIDSRFTGDGPVFVEDLPLFTEPAFAVEVNPLLGKPITLDLAKELIQLIGRYARSRDMLAVATLPPTQVIRTGTVRLVVTFARYKEISFQGNRWFSQQLLADRLGIKAGELIRFSALEEAVNWVNASPFRQVKVLVNELPTEPGKANLIVGVQEHRPFRAAFAVDNTGNAIIGRVRHTASLQFGNLWGRDHLGSYQFLTSDDPQIYQAHAVDYRWGLAARHFVQLAGSYVKTHPTFFNGALSQEGESINTSLRYTVPLRFAPDAFEVFSGINYKQSNSNVDFIGLAEALRVRTEKADTFQAFLGASYVKRDRHGGWLFSGTITGSPGNINSRNTDRAYWAARDNVDVTDPASLATAKAFGVTSNTSATYVYGSLTVQRFVRLPYGWEAMARGSFQRASHNLLPGEHMGVGGASTVRGYEENIYAAENGQVLNFDLMSPTSAKKLPISRVRVPPLEMRALGFLDVGKVDYRHRYNTDIRFSALASVGVGLRASLGNNFSAAFDYGWQLTHLARQLTQTQRAALGSRGHLKVVLAF